MPSNFLALQNLNRVKMDNQHPDKISNRNVSLSNRELEVLFLIAKENTNTEIAKKLGLSKGTIDTYRNNILAKLNAKNTAGMVRIAFEHGILNLNENSQTILEDTRFKK